MSATEIIAQHDMNYIEKVPLDLFLEIIKDLTYNEIGKLCRGNRTLSNICQIDKVKAIIERKRQHPIYLPPRRTHQAFTSADLTVGAIINKVLLTDFTRDHKSLLKRYIKELDKCDCGRTHCKHDEWNIVGVEDLSNLEAYEKYNFIRGNKYDIKTQPYVITRIIGDQLYARKIERVNGKWQYLTHNEEVLNPYPLKQSRAFLNSTKVGYMFGDGNIAIIPNSFKTK